MSWQKICGKYCILIPGRRDLGGGVFLSPHFILSGIYVNILSKKETSHVNSMLVFLGTFKVLPFFFSDLLKTCIESIENEQHFKSFKSKASRQV